MDTTLSVLYRNKFNRVTSVKTFTLLYIYTLLKRLIIVSANSPGSSLHRRLSSSIPSAPTDVVTTGIPADRYSSTLTLIPAPILKGATATWHFEKYGKTSFTKPVTIMSSELRFAILSGGLAPTT